MNNVILSSLWLLRKGVKDTLKNYVMLPHRFFFFPPWNKKWKELNRNDLNKTELSFINFDFLNWRNNYDLIFFAI